MSAILDAALAYARKGRRVVPLHDVDDDRCSCGMGCAAPGKHPRVMEWPRKATANEVTIGRWWEMFPNANLGYLTGDGVGVLDIDPRNGGGDSLATLEAKHGRLPETA